MMTRRESGMHVLTVDLEEYFQVEAFSDVVRRDQWDNYPSRVGPSARVLLDLLDEAGATGTFFVVGWLALRHGALLREIAGRGHEIACHSFWHRLAYDLTPKEFKDDTLLAKEAIEQETGVAVRGYRAPSFSITKESLWALEVLAECGFSYDASIFPIHHDIYGMPAAPRRPFVACDGSIAVCPMTTFRWLGRNWPVGGGAYLRLLPWWYTQMGIGRAQREGIPVVGYVHPWELDPEQPRIRGRARSVMRHYTNLPKTKHRLRRLLALARFSSFRKSRLLEAGAIADDHMTVPHPIPPTDRWSTRADPDEIAGTGVEAVEELPLLRVPPDRLSGHDLCPPNTYRGEPAEASSTRGSAGD